MEELKSCPFCGNVGIGGAVAKLHHVLGHKHPKADEEKAFAYCTKYLEVWTNSIYEVKRSHQYACDTQSGKGS